MNKVFTTIFTVVKLYISIVKANLFTSFFNLKLGSVGGGGSVTSELSFVFAPRTTKVELGVIVLALETITLVGITLVTVVLKVLILGKVIPVNLGGVIGLGVSTRLGAKVWG